MRKRHKQAKRPSGRDIARSFLAAIITKGKKFESMKQQEERRTDE